MSPLPTFLALAAQLEGMEVTHLWRGHGSALFLEFGALAPRQRRDGSPGHPEGEVSLAIEWSWRIESANAIVCGSWSDEKLWEPTFQLLRNRKVEQLKLFGRLPEVSLSLSGDLHLLSFSTTDGQPQWSVADRRGNDHVWFSVRDGQLNLE